MSEREEKLAALLVRAQAAMERQLVEFERMNARWLAVCEAQVEQLAALQRSVGIDTPAPDAPSLN